MKYNTFFIKAMHEAENSTFYKQNIGCVIVYKNRIISIGHNSNKTHPIQKKYNRIRFEECASPDSLHAEIHALSQISDRNINWSKVTVYTYRKMRGNGKAGMARPCPSCMAYIKSLGIKNICYTTNEGIAHEKLDI